VNLREAFVVACGPESVAYDGSTWTLFWRPNNAGYTPRLDEAKLHTADEALRIQATHGPRVARAVPWREAAAASVPVVPQGALA
jgi:hypothetical protein